MTTNAIPAEESGPASQERLAEQERQRSLFADAHGRLDCRASEYRQAHAIGLIREMEERPSGPPQARVELHPHSLAVCSGPTCYPLKNQIYSPFVPRNFAEDVPKTSDCGKRNRSTRERENQSVGVLRRTWFLEMGPRRAGPSGLRRNNGRKTYDNA